jgi:hypothetical protein
LPFRFPFRFRHTPDAAAFRVVQAAHASASFLPRETNAHAPCQKGR